MRALLFALVLVAGCAKKKADPGPTCAQVVDNMMVVMKQGMAGHDSVELANRQQMIDQCEQRKLSANERRCMVEAKDLSALAACRPAKPAPTRPLPTTPAPEPAAAPTGSAGSSS